MNRTLNGKTSVISLFNFDENNKARDVEIRFSKKCFGSISEANLFSPDHDSDGGRPLEIDQENGGYVLRVSEVDVCGFVALSKA